VYCGLCKSGEYFPFVGENNLFPNNIQYKTSFGKVVARS